MKAEHIITNNGDLVKRLPCKVFKTEDGCCPSCGAKPGDYHDRYCDEEECPICKDKSCLSLYDCNKWVAYAQKKNSTIVDAEYVGMDRLSLITCSLKKNTLKEKQTLQKTIDSFLNKFKSRYRYILEQVIGTERFKHYNRFKEDICDKYIDNFEDAKFYRLYVGLKKIKERLLYAEYTIVCSREIEESIEFLTKNSILFKFKKESKSLYTNFDKYLDKIKDKIKEGKNKIVKYFIKKKKIASFSGGKDSAFMVIECLKKGIEFDHIVFADTTLEFPEIYEYIDKFEKYIGRKITRLKPKHTFEELFFREFCRGKYEGEIHGLPFVVGQGCYIKRDMKLKQIKEFKRQLGNDYVDYIGIAYDEPERYKRMLFGQQYAPLYEWKITENDCLEGLKKIGLHNELYDRFSRLGCWLCPKQNQNSLYSLYKYYPDLWEKLKWYESKDFKPFKPNKSIEEIEKKFILLG